MPFRLHGIFQESLVVENRETADRIAAKLRSYGDRFQTNELAFPGVAIEKPVIVLGAPRSGTSLMLETLAVCPKLWWLGGESHAVFEAPGAAAPERGNCLAAIDADPATCEKVRLAFLCGVYDRDRRLFCALPEPERPGAIRLLEKTPRNALRIPFLKSVFPDAKFVFIYRQPRENLASLLDRWYAQERPTYTLDGFGWKFLLVPGWRDLVLKPIPEIAAAQWAIAATSIVNDLAKLPRTDWCAVRYEDLIANPLAEVSKVCHFAALEMDDHVMDRLNNPLPLSRSTVTPPSPDKWRRHEEVLKTILPSVEYAAAAVEAFLSNCAPNTL
jgi:hypothetical protein